MRHAAHVGEELLREDRDVGLVEAGRREDVDDAFGCDRARDDLAHGVLHLLIGAHLARGALGERRAHRLEERDIVSDACRLLVRDGKGERQLQLAHDADEALLPSSRRSAGRIHIRREYPLNG